MSILRALLADSDCVIMDEPLRGLDEKTRIKTIDYILKKTEGKTLIFVTHEEQEAVWLKADKTLKFMKDHLIKWSGLEMSQNAMHLSWSAAEVDEKLHTIMHGIHAQCVKYGTEPDGYINYVKGANIAGFMKVAHAMMGQGII